MLEDILLVLSPTILVGLFLLIRDLRAQRETPLGRAIAQATAPVEPPFIAAQRRAAESKPAQGSKQIPTLRADPPLHRPTPSPRAEPPLSKATAEEKPSPQG